MNSQGTVVSFYSYKGGVGRTMTVVNVAMTLACNGFHVLVVDLDLLAPGVQSYPKFCEAIAHKDYIPPEEREFGQGGVLDLIERQIWSAEGFKAKSPFKDRFRPGDASPKVWQNWARPVYAHPLSNGHIHVLPAGPAHHGAVDKLSQIGWFNFLTQKEFGGLKFILSMRDLWWRKEYDFVLIDSRTGLSDYLQFCVGILPSVAVMIAGLNTQNLEGLKVALGGMKKVLEEGRKTDLQVIPVLSLVPFGELDELKNRFDTANKLLETIKEQSAPDDTRTGVRLLGEEAVKLPYVATLAIGERLVVPEHHEAPIFRSYVRIAEMLARHRFAKIDNLIEEAIYEGAAEGLKDPPKALEEAQAASKTMEYMWGRIRCISLNAQRLAYGGFIGKEMLEHFNKAIQLMRERRGLRLGESWKAEAAPLGHWQIELDTLILYARMLVVLGEADSAKRKEGIRAFTDVIDFLEYFEKRNHADIFSDQDWEKYSHEVLFKKAFCHLHRLEAQNKEIQSGGIYTAALDKNLRDTRDLFHQFGINERIKARIDKVAHDVQRYKTASAQTK